MMKELIFIRHAETDMRGLYCGHANPPINAAGEYQIKSLLYELKEEKIDAIFTSDLQRAVSTASSLAQVFTTRPVIRSQLREINFGDWEGLCWSDIETQDAALARCWLNAFPHLRAPRGEAYELFRSRVLDEVSDIVRTEEGKCIAVVTHGGVLRVVLQTLCSMSQQEALANTTSYCTWFKYKVCL